MNILIATHDFVSRKAHLMPWRVIGEAADGLRAQSSNVVVVSLVRDPVNSTDTASPDDVIQVGKQRGQLAPQLSELIKKYNIDIIFWPLTWREPRWRIKVLDTLPIAKVGYIPGGVFSFRACLYALRRLGVIVAAPYLIDSIVPKQRLVRLALNAGITDLIVLSELTATAAVTAGWDQRRVHYIPPGKDALISHDPGMLPEATTNWLMDDPFFLFMGPPSSIRGIYELLEAFDIAANRHSTIRLICLFRPDDELDSAKIKRVIADSKYQDRIHAVWDGLDRSMLNGYMSRSVAIVMPFILVPSEIPLAIIEALALHKPVIATSPGGTGNFVKQFGFAPRVGDILAMADAMLLLVENIETREEKSRQAERVYTQLNDWSGMASAWLTVARGAK